MAKSLPFTDDETTPSYSLRQGRITDALTETAQALDAFNMMLQDHLLTGDGLREQTVLGISRLLDGQIRILAATTNEVEKVLAERRAEADTFETRLSPDAMTLRREVIRTSLGAGADPSTLSQAINLPRSAIARVVAQLKGETPTHAAATA